MTPWTLLCGAVAQARSRALGELLPLADGADLRLLDRSALDEKDRDALLAYLQGAAASPTVPRS